MACRRARDRTRRPRAGAACGDRAALSARLHARRDRGAAGTAARHRELTPAARPRPARGGASAVSERDVERLFAAVPADRAAEARAWELVRAAYAEYEPARARPRLRWAPAAAVLLCAVAAAAFSSPGRTVVDAVRRTIGVEHAAPALFRLPAPGRLLVSGKGGTWLVASDGSKRRLGAYTRAAWSPHGLFVVAATADELATLEPRTGSVHWTLSRPQIAFPRWGGSRTDTRIA